MDGSHLHLASLPAWRGGLLVLMYHAVEAPPLFHGHRALYVEPALLDAQIVELQSADVPFTTLSAWAQVRPAERRVILTFDDAFQNVFERALPVMLARGVTGITYVVAGEIGGANRWDAGRAQLRPLMDRAALRDWLAAGQEIGSHALDHLHLADLTPARTQIFDSKKRLEDVIGRPVPHFCYPYGSCNAVVRDLVAEAGYETATTIERGVNVPNADPFLLRRHPASHPRPYRTALMHRLRHPFGLPARATR